MSVASRVKELRKALDLTQQEFADRLGVKRSAVANWDLDRSDPSDAMVSLICREFSVREAWLRTGEGEMFARRSEDEERALFFGSLAKEDASPEVLAFIDALRKTPESAMRTVFRFVSDVYESYHSAKEDGD